MNSFLSYSSLALCVLVSFFPRMLFAAPAVISDCADCPDMLVIPAGQFSMGSPPSEMGRQDNEGVPHLVSVPSFALAKTEVTQGQWRALMGSNPSHFSRCGDDCPVENISWDEAQSYVRQLSEKTAQTYRLPTEAEWEYACRAGGSSLYCGGDSPDSLAWYSTNAKQRSHVVAGKQTNAFGLFDMTGNLWEWVEDCWHSNYEGAPTDGSAWRGAGCQYHMLRGGSWFDQQPELRAATRFGFEAGFKGNKVGFRPARVVNP